MSFNFSWHYFATFCIGMFFLYWLVFVLAMWIKNALNDLRIEHLFLHRLGLGGYFLGAMLGSVTPFCSCTTVPIFLIMIESEIRLGYALSFMIASPTINPPAIILMYALFGWKMMLVYILAAYLIAVIGGIILDTKKNAKRLIELLFISTEEDRLSLKEASLRYLSFIKSFGIVIVVAAAIAAWLTTWSPPTALLESIEHNRQLAMPLTVLLGGVIYTDIALLIPIGSIFQAKGMDLGLIFAFMMAASGVGLPSIILLTRIFQWKLLLSYLFTVFCLITITGYSVSFLF